MDPRLILTRGVSTGLRLGRGTADRVVTLAGPPLGRLSDKVVSRVRRPERRGPTTFTPSKRDDVPEPPPTRRGPARRLPPWPATSARRGPRRSPPGRPSRRASPARSCHRRAPARPSSDKFGHSRGVTLPDPALVVLVGPSGSGKSTWAQGRYRRDEVVSSDALRGVVGSGPHDLDATADAFDLLERVVAARTGRGLTTVVDTLGTDDDRRRRLAGPGPRGRAARRGRRAWTPRTPSAGAATPPGTGRCRRRPWPASSSGTARWCPSSSSRAGTSCTRCARTTAAEPPVAPEPVAGGRGAAYVAGAEGGAPGQPVPVGRGPAGLADRRRPGRRRGRLRRVVGDGPPHPDPPGRPGVGLDPRAVGDPRRGRRARHRPRAGHPGHAGDVPGARASPPRPPPPWTCSPAAGRSSASAPAGGSASTRRTAWTSRSPRQRLDDLERGIETMRALWAAGTKAYDGERVSLPETTCYPRPVGRHPGDRGRDQAADPADRGHAR